MSYEQVYNGDWWDYAADTRVECCRCGLRHRVFVRKREGKYQLRFDRIQDGKKAKKS